MSEKRKDNKGQILKTGESQRKELRVKHKNKKVPESLKNQSLKAYGGI